MDRHEQRDLAIAVALGELSPEAGAAAQAMIAGDAELTQLMSDVRRAVEGLAGGDFVDVPRHLCEAAKGLMSSSPETADWLESLSKVLATWVPRRMVAGAPGFRGTEEGSHVEYTSEAGTVHLMVSPPEAGRSRWRVRGSIESRRGRASEVAFVRAEGREVEGQGRIESDGRFRVEVPPGVFNVFVRFDDTAMEIRELRIG